jgi:hypothetical protein
LAVPLDDGLGPDSDIVWVLTGVAPGPPLAQEVPALVEGDFDLAQAILLLLGKFLALVRPFQAVFFLGQLVDAVHYVHVVHLPPS